VDQVVRRLDRAGWDPIVEASFAIRGERGSIDVFARHRSTNTILVVEVKSVVPDAQAMLHALDRKTRLAAEIARAQAGRASLLAACSSSASRRRRIGGWGSLTRCIARRFLREPGR